MAGFVAEAIRCHYINISGLRMSMAMGCSCVSFDEALIDAGPRYFAPEMAVRLACLAERGFH